MADGGSLDRPGAARLIGAASIIAPGGDSGKIVIAGVIVTAGGRPRATLTAREACPALLVVPLTAESKLPP